jgi:Uma2 family endonuclease
MEYVRPKRGSPGLEYYEQPLPLVVEVWSPSTGEYDIDSKLPEYQARGDKEIWRLHPYERTVRSWQRQPDGS